MLPVKPAYKLFLIFCWLPLIALCYYNHPYLDDYWVGQLGQTKGVLEAQRHLFVSWTGRFASSFFFVSLNPLSYGWLGGVKLTAVLNIVVKISVLWVALRSLSNKTIPALQAAWLAAGIALLYICLVPDKYSTVYYFTDLAVYQLPAAFLLLVPVAVERMHRAPTRLQRRLWAVVAGVATIQVAAGNEMSLALLAVTLLTGVVMSVIRKQKKSAAIWASLLALLVLAGGIAVIAPGNYERLKTYGPTPYLPPMQLAQRMGAALKYIFTDANTLLTLALPLALGPLAARLLPARPPGLRLPLVVGAAIVLLGTCLGAAPYNLIPQPFERPMNVLEWWLLLGWLTACWASMPANEPPIVSRPIRLVVAGAVVLALSVTCGRAWVEFLINAPSYSRQWEERNQVLKQAAASGSQIVELRPILQVQPRHVLIRGYDNQPKYNDVRNMGIAKWYGLDSVRTNPRLLSQALF